MSPTRYLSTGSSRRSPRPGVSADSPGSAQVSAPQSAPGGTPDSAGGSTAEELDRLFSSTVSLFHRMGAVAEELHREANVSGGMRGVLRQLRREGPLTIPHMARSRPVTRQHIQSLVQDLLDRGLVERRPNPAHRRSFLVGLTAAGEVLVAEMATREKAALEDLAEALPSRSVRDAARLLDQVREYFESDRRQSTPPSRR